MNTIIKDKNRIFIGDAIKNEYLIDPNMKSGKHPFALCFPISEQEVTEIVKYAIKNDYKIVTRGAQTNVTGSTSIINENEIIIDLSKMNRIIDFDKETMTLTLEPGVTLGEIQRYIEKEDYFYPPDPGAKNATIGGNIATNAGGMKAVKYGVTRDYVKSLNVVLPNAKLISVGSLNVKDSSGYDLKDLFIGSEGTLGIITLAKLKIIAKTKYLKQAILSFESTVKASNAVLTILNSGITPESLEIIDKEITGYCEDYLNVKFPLQSGETFVLLNLDGNDENLISQTFKTIVDLTKNDLVSYKELNQEEAKNTWALRDSILLALKNKFSLEMLDEVVPINNFAKMISYTKELQSIHQIKVLNFGHAGDGNIHTVLLKNGETDTVWNQKKVAFLDDLYRKVYELGGLISAEHGIGIVKKLFFHKYTDPNKIALMRALKHALDPNNLLNPGKIL